MSISGSINHPEHPVTFSLLKVFLPRIHCHWKLKSCSNTDSSSCQAQRSVKSCPTASVSCAARSRLPASLLGDVLNQRKPDTAHLAKRGRGREVTCGLLGGGRDCDFKFCHIFSEEAVPIIESCIAFQQSSNVAFAHLLQGCPPAISAVLLLWKLYWTFVR